MNTNQHSKKSSDWREKPLSENQKKAAAYAASKSWMGAAEAFNVVRDSGDPSMPTPAWLPEDETHRALYALRMQSKHLGTYEEIKK